MKRRYFKQVRLSQFRALMEVARGEGFAAAAEALELSTPSVWQQIRSLEDEFKTPLVLVRKQQVDLTPQGKLLCRLAEPVVHGFDAIVDRFSEQSQSMQQVLRVASPASILVYELPSPIVSFHQQHSGVDLSFIDVPSNLARQLLEDGEVDLAVVGILNSNIPKSIVADPVARFPFMIAGPAEHPIMKVKKLSVKTVAKYPLVMSGTGTNTRSRVDEVFTRAGLLDQLKVVCHTSAKQVILQYVQYGLGIAILPVSPFYQARESLLPSNRSSLAFRDGSSLFGSEEIVVLRRRHLHEADLQKAFRQVVIDSGRQIGPPN